LRLFLDVLPSGVAPGNENWAFGVVKDRVGRRTDGAFDDRLTEGPVIGSKKWAGAAAF
jgi:hypothetical protein